MKTMATFLVSCLLLVSCGTTPNQPGPASGAVWTSTQRTSGAVFNAQAFTTSTRVPMLGNSGNSWTVTPWSGFNYTKLSSTSKLLLWFTAPSLSPGTPNAAGASVVNLNVGGVAMRNAASNAQPSTSAGNSSIVAVVTGMSAGVKAVSVDYMRFDGIDWNTNFCPNSTDETYYPSSLAATLMIAELGP